MSRPEPGRRTTPSGVARRWGDRMEEGHEPFDLATAFAAFAIFTGFAGDFWRNLLTWWGFGVIVVLVFVAAVILFVRRRPPLRFSHLPAPLVLFVAWCTISVAWSAYRPETLLGSAAQLITAFVGLTIAVTVSKVRVLRALSIAMRAIVGLSLVFELIVALFFPKGVLPLYMLLPGALDSLSGIPGATIDTVPGGFKWSQGHLFSNAAIQGIVGNRNLLAMVALLCIIAVAVQLGAGQLKRWQGIAWLATAVVTLALCRSMTAFAAFGIVAFAYLLVRIARPLPNSLRWIMYGIVGTLMVIGVSFVVLFNNELFALINRSSDMSGRGDIWWAVSQIARDHWVVGLGWVSYWAPWVEPFSDLQVVDGITYLQAHNAYIDAWMQVGVIGAGLLVALMLSTLVRSWWLAIDRPQYGADDGFRIPPTAVLAFLVTVALAVQSLTESRLLIEGNWLLMCYFAIYSKLRIQDLPALPRRTLPDHTGPIMTIGQRPLLPATLELPVPEHPNAAPGKPGGRAPQAPSGG
ncbi:hypothetical protein HNR16_002446 [Pseudoclavibacter chungangensis]|nr:O-antigen ligase family protein [Pseudoclavibacter chungangensis]NYJ67658.1 hypothetical protein [Pseudoclavibacter chungangensis]